MGIVRGGSVARGVAFARGWRGDVSFAIGRVKEAGGRSFCFLSPWPLVYPFWRSGLRRLLLRSDQLTCPGDQPVISSLIGQAGAESISRKFWICREILYIICRPFGIKQIASLAKMEVRCQRSEVGKRVGCSNRLLAQPDHPLIGVRVGS